MDEQSAVAAVRTRALELARTGEHRSWADIFDTLVVEGYLDAYNPEVADDATFHAELKSICEQSTST